ncbi:MAG: 4Fe-4S binding protein [Oscillospiraceae bacterium]|jgi:pyruvate ferredoxin oxidoreductase delta subunit|nr:4Fe-4S binding protein [Oscillospiraceae bacterium]
MNYVKGVNQDQPWYEVNEAGTVLGGGTSLAVNTGEWRIMIPAWHEKNCIQCLLCFPVCADSSIPVKDEKRGEFDFTHCKGCGVCYKVCPTFRKTDAEKAITFEKEDK